MVTIDASRRIDLEHLVEELRRTARTIRSSTLAERRQAREALVIAVRDRLESHARRDVEGLEALGVWVEALEHADVNDVDLLQELLYGIDALVRVHVCRETDLPLAPPMPRPSGDV